jgi:phosphoglycolate phosphatase-like HAD superfamily hydrolase
MIAQHALDPRACFMLGDRATDIAAGLAAGVRVAAMTHGKLDRVAWAQAGFADLPLYDDLAAFAATLV